MMRHILKQCIVRWMPAIYSNTHCHVYRQFRPVFLIYINTTSNLRQDAVCAETAVQEVSYYKFTEVIWAKLTLRTGTGMNLTIRTCSVTLLKAQWRESRESRESMLAIDLALASRTHDPHVSCHSVMIPWLSNSIIPQFTCTRCNCQLPPPTATPPCPPAKLQCWYIKRNLQAPLV